MDVSEKLKIADEALVRISGIIFSFDIVTPHNIDEEWEKFQESKGTYSPQLAYDQFDPEPYIKELQELDIPKETPMGRLFEGCRNEMLKYAKMLRNVGTPDFNTKAYFGTVEDELLIQAHNIIDMKQPKVKAAEKTISSQELAKRMEDELKRYGVHDWKITFRKNASSPVSINSGKKNLIINKNSMYSEYRVKKLLIHEIGTHVLRAVNGDNQEFQIFRVGLPGYDVTEEGLAGFNEREQGYKSKQIMTRYAIRVFATKVASVGGFLDVYDVIRPLVDSDERAFKTSVRIKRGLNDTSQPGGLLKDHVYLKGMLLIEDFVENGGDIRDLYVGKIRVSDIPLVKSSVLKPATILPDFLR